MATSSKFQQQLLRQVNGSSVVDFDTDTIKVAILTSSYTEDLVNHDFFNDVSAFEVTGTNYPAGGVALANKAVALNAGVVSFDADDIVIAQSPSGFANGRKAVVYKDTGTPATSPLITLVDFGGDLGNTLAALRLTWNAAGIETWA